MRSVGVRRSPRLASVVGSSPIAGPSGLGTSSVVPPPVPLPQPAASSTPIRHSQQRTTCKCKGMCSTKALQRSERPPLQPALQVFEYSVQKPRKAGELALLCIHIKAMFDCGSPPRSLRKGAPCYALRHAAIAFYVVRYSCDVTDAILIPP
jgi:hypothetical protein